MAPFCEAERYLLPPAVGRAVPAEPSFYIVTFALCFPRVRRVCSSAAHVICSTRAAIKDNQPVEPLPLKKRATIRYRPLLSHQMYGQHTPPKYPEPIGRIAQPSGIMQIAAHPQIRTIDLIDQIAQLQRRQQQSTGRILDRQRHPHRLSRIGQSHKPIEQPIERLLIPAPKPPRPC